MINLLVSLMILSYLLSSCMERQASAVKGLPYSRFWNIVYIHLVGLLGWGTGHKNKEVDIYIYISRVGIEPTIQCSSSTHLTSFAHCDRFCILVIPIQHNLRFQVFFVLRFQNERFCYATIFVCTYATSVIK
jgi:hypothetical protein